MKANDFVSDILDILGEGTTYAPIWTRANILSYLRKTLRRFSQATFSIDGDSLRYVDSSTGESSVPSNFLNPYYVSYDKSQLDVVSLGELDFITATWSLNTTGTSPLVSTVMGTGKDTTVRVVPVPTSPLGPFGYAVLTSAVLANSNGIGYTLSVDTSGVMSSTLTETNKVTNYTMELDSNWSDFDWLSAGGLTQSRTSTEKYSGTYSRTFTANGVDGYYQGVKSDTFTTVTGVTYAWKANVFPHASNTYGAVVVQIRYGDGSGFNETSTHTGLTKGAWNTISGDYVETKGGSGAYFAISVGPEPAGTYYVDDVVVVPSTTGSTIVLGGGASTYWTLSVDSDGAVSTTSSASTTGSSLLLVDSNSMYWNIGVSSSGVITTNSSYGRLVRMELDGTNQDFTSNYGTVSDAYAYGSSTTPSAVARLDGPYGVVTMGRVSDGALHVWYKGLIDDTPNLESEIYLNDCFIPIIQHGVLALAFNAECAGRDTDKAKAFEVIFTLECESVRRIFNRK